jgi:putative tricarboxylic transport membrane protein
MAPFILAMILGPSIEVAFRQSLIGSGGSFFVFVERPIALTLIVLSCGLFIYNTLKALGIRTAPGETGIRITRLFRRPPNRRSG